MIYRRYLGVIGSRELPAIPPHRPRPAGVAGLLVGSSRGTFFTTQQARKKGIIKELMGYGFKISDN